jgi:hypothetical protein
MLTVYHRSRAGRVVSIELQPAEFAAAVTACPWEWSANPVFAAWPADRGRAEVIEPPSIADTVGATSASSLWGRS